MSKLLKDDDVPAWLKGIVITLLVASAVLVVLGIMRHKELAPKKEAYKALKIEYAKRCQQVGWVVVEIKHGKAENQFLCLPEAPGGQTHWTEYE